jgi:hypothetical protein
MTKPLARYSHPPRVISAVDSLASRAFGRMTVKST